MTRILQATFLLLWVLTSYGQSTVDIVAENSDLSIINLQEETISHSTIYNKSDTDTLYLTWQKSILGYDSGWDISICDKNKCYNSDIEKNVDVIILPPGETSILDLRINPKNKSGNTKLKIELYDIRNESIVDSEIYDIQGQNKVASKGLHSDIKIYPNPTSDIFYLKNDKDISKISILNIVGKEIRSFNHMPGSSYELSFLKNGIYIVRLHDNSNNTLKVLRLHKK